MVRRDSVLRALRALLTGGLPFDGKPVDTGAVFTAQDGQAVRRVRRDFRSRSRRPRIPRPAHRSVLWTGRLLDVGVYSGEAARVTVASEGRASQAEIAVDAPDPSSAP
jgi:hypothetical protein